MVEEIIQTQGKKKKIMPFDIFVVLFMLIIVITTIYPFWYTIVVSLSGVDKNQAGFSSFPIILL